MSPAGADSAKHALMDKDEAEEKPAKEMVAELKELSQKTGVSEPEVVVLVSAF